jgi:hypothetical protein
VLRNLLLVCSAAATAVVAFAGVSLAQDRTGTSGLASFPAAELPSVALPEPARLAAQNLIGGSAERLGITAASFENAKVLTETTLGPIYVVFGEKGVCLALVPREGVAPDREVPAGTACGANGDPRDAVAVFLRDPSSGFMVGGGLVSAATATVELDTGGRKVTPTRVPGGFAISAADRIEFHDLGLVTLR